ncbi:MULTISPECIES: alpha/beta fold hydrolase [unclassified Streptomyces]|uniref:alpha/beta fold hydrolase n=1 Tax=unclassified Streptomyces TaxID=2593676 RepID=UPI00380068D0
MNSPARATTGRLPVPGATLYYEVRGRTGPPLLLLAGGNSDAAVFEALAACLATDHRVLVHDPRGNSRSPLDGPPVDQRVEEHADDIGRLLDHLVPTGEPVALFGSCAGGLAALHFTVLHPERVSALVVHEPPAFRLLPDADDHMRLVDTVEEIRHREGTGAAMAALAVLFGGRPAPDLPEARDNTEFFLAHMLRPSTRYLPDLDAVAAVAARIAVAGGTGSRDQTVHRPARALAAHLAQELVEFPGGHVGYAKHPHEFATVLRRTLAKLPRVEN